MLSRLRKRDYLAIQELHLGLDLIAEGLTDRVPAGVRDSLSSIQLHDYRLLTLDVWVVYLGRGQRWYSRSVSRYLGLGL